MQIVDLFITFIFLLSFQAKSKNVLDFKYEILSYHLVPKKLVHASAYGVLFTELAIALLYLVKPFLLLKTLLAGSLIIAFTLGTAYKNKLDGQSSCSCFGELSWLNKYPITRNMVILAFILADAVLHKVSSEAYPFHPLLATVVVIVIVYGISIVVSIIHGSDDFKAVDINQALSHIQGSPKEILVLPYTTPYFDTIDKLLGLESGKQHHIIFFSPSWMVKIKTKNWLNHNVIDGNQHDWCSPLNSNEAYLLRRRNNKLVKINYIVELLKEELNERAPSEAIISQIEQRGSSL